MLVVSTPNGTSNDVMSVNPLFEKKDEKQTAETVRKFKSAHEKDLEIITQVLVKITSRSLDDIEPYLDTMLERLITVEQEATNTEDHFSSRQRKKPFDARQWQADMNALAQRVELPILPEEAFTRESIYGEHD
jgi:UPF0288 family protein (methanogenesis marker protein 3)